MKTSGRLIDATDAEIAWLEGLNGDPRKVWPHFRTLFLMALSGWLFVTTVVVGLYAYRQRAWADKLHAQLVLTNLDDVKLMRLLTAPEKEDIARRFREQGELRIADWISKQ